MRIPLEIVTGDQSAALFAFGEPDPDTVYANLGTGAFLQRSCGTAKQDPGRLLASVVYQDKTRSVQVIEGTINGAGSALSSVASDLGITALQLEKQSAVWLEKFTADVLFVNAISGLGSPWWLASAESHFAGSAADTAQPCEKLAAVMESIVFLLMTNLEIMNQLCGKPGRLLATGGLSAVDPLLQCLANLSQWPVERAVSREATACGLACLLAGVPTDWPGATIERVFSPAEDVGLLRRYRQWQELMPSY
jgi:glycerol kinase